MDDKKTAVNDKESKLLLRSELDLEREQKE